MPQALPFVTAATGLYAATKGGGDKKTTTTQLDPQTNARYDDLYRRAQGVAALPFTPYTGSRVAGFNPDQLTSFDAVRNQFGQSMANDPRGQLAGMGQAPLDINSFYNPFQEQVIDNAMSDLNRGRQFQIQSDQDAAIGRDAFGGSRSAILEAETNRNFADRAGNLAANLRRQGFDSSADLAMRDRNYRTGINQSLLGDQYKNLGFLSGIGGIQQGLQQGAMDRGYDEFLRGLNYPGQQLGLLQGSVLGMSPGQSTSTINQQGLLGRLQSGADTYYAANDFFDLFKSTPTTGPAG